MLNRIENLVFEGGGILGIAYLGVLDYLFCNDLMINVRRAAGASAGAITACVTSFNLPFKDVKAVADSLDYKKVPYRGEIDGLKYIPEAAKKYIEQLFGDVDCIFRLLNNYGWYSTEYFYNWIKAVIESQFDAAKKQPPYTFADFKDPLMHKQNRSFLDLYIIGTNLSNQTSRVFSFETTPMMEVAQAVTISMSIPLFFEAVDVNDAEVTGNYLTNVFCDGGVMNNYPINIFDSLQFQSNPLYGVNMNTLGARFTSSAKYLKINNLLEFIVNLSYSSMRIQQESYDNSPMDKARSISINTLDISPVDFDVSPNDDTYNFLYSQGYHAAETYFSANAQDS